MFQSTVPVLFESSDNLKVFQDPANEEWVAVLRTIEGEDFEALERRYYLALQHFRKQPARPMLTGHTEIPAQGKQQAFQAVLETMDQRKAARKAAEPAASEVFVETLPDQDDRELPAALRDFNITPPSLSTILAGPGRPPCDALCLLRAFLAAPLLGVEDNPTSVFQLLHNNPTFAHLCGFLGRDVVRQQGELTSRKIPSQAVCEEFTEVMTRYGLWHHARQMQVATNIETGVVEVEQTVVFDTTHVVANSHCGNVVPKEVAAAQDGKKPKQRKVPRLQKQCDCGKDNWESCCHSWVLTDPGAAVVVKGPTRVYWAHKASVVAFGSSEVPFDVRVCQYAAESDGNTLVPHLELLQRDLPQCITGLRFVLADDAYRGHLEEVALFGQEARLVVPVHPKKTHPSLAEEYDGIHHFTPIGIPVCEEGHRFVFQGRDIKGERYIWAAPKDDEGDSVCRDCPLSGSCLKRGDRRHIRIPRADLPHIDWDHPQHSARERVRYGVRTGVERAIKRIKVDLLGEHLTHRHARRVQAHLDRKLLTLHLLLQVAAYS
jgi:hypothetical protein